MDNNKVPPGPQQPTPPYEKREVNVRGIMIAVLVLLIVAAVVHVLMWLEFAALDTRSKLQDPKASPLLPARQVPPGPHLDAKSPVFSSPGTEPFNTSNLRATRSEEKNMLDSYAWVDSGYVRIPIEEAMKLVVEKEKQKQPGSQTQTAPD